MNLYGVVTGTNDYSLNVAFPPGFKLCVGDTITINPLNANTGAATLSVGGLAPLPLTLNGAALTSGQLEAGKDRQCTFKGSSFACDNAGGGGGGYTPSGTADQVLGGDGVARYLGASDMPTGIDATKLADGSVTNAELQYIGTLTSNAQTQISARLPLAGGTMTGDLIIPAANLKPSGSGGTGHLLRQTSSGGAISSGALTPSDIPYSGYYSGKASDQSVAVSTSADVTFTTNEQISADVTHSISTNPAEFTVNTAQKYAVDVALTVIASTGAAWNRGEIRLYVNGVMVRRQEVFVYYDGTTGLISLPGVLCWEGPVVAGQIIKVVFANLGATNALSIAGQSSSVNRSSIRIQGRGV